MQDTRIAPYEQKKPRKIKPYEHKAHYYETDKMGIVHHSNHIRWMEEARMDLLEQLGLIIVCLMFIRFERKPRSSVRS